MKPHDREKPPHTHFAVSLPAVLIVLSLGLSLSPGCASHPPEVAEKPTVAKHKLEDPESATILAAGPLGFYQQCLVAKGLSAHQLRGGKVKGTFNLVINTRANPFRLESFEVQPSKENADLKPASDCARKAKSEFNAKIPSVLKNLKKDHPNKTPFKEIQGKKIFVRGKMFPFTSIAISDEDKSIESDIPELDLEQGQRTR